MPSESSCFSVFLNLFRPDFGMESKRNKNIEMIFSGTKEDQGASGPSQVGSKEPTSSHSATTGEAAVSGLVASPVAPDLDPWPIYSQIFSKKSGEPRKYFPPPQASVSARSHLETLLGTLPEGTLELEGLFIIIITPPMTRE